MMQEQIDILLAQGRYQMAYDLLKKQLSQDPEDTNTLSMLSMCCLNLGKLEEAESILHKTISMEPWNGTHKYFMAHLYAQKKMLPQALELIDEAIEFDAYNANFFDMKARLLLAQKKYPQAEEAARMALAIDGQNLDAANSLSQALQSQSKNEEASIVMDKILELNPENWETHTNYGYRKLEQGKVRDAIDHFRNALIHDPTQEYAQHGMKLAMKAKFPLYRWLLQFQLYMSKQGQAANFGVIFGIIILLNILRRMEDSVNGFLRYILFGFIAVLVGFVFSSWILDPIMNFVLYTQKNGRLALDEEEKKSAKFVGVNLLLILIGIVLALTLSNLAGLQVSGIGFMGLMVTNNLFGSGAKRSKLISMGFYIGVATCFSIALFSLFISQEPDSIFSTAAVILAVLYTWVGNGAFSK